MTKYEIEANSCDAPAQVADTCGQQACLPRPYYRQSSMCAEDNKEVRIIERISQVFRTRSAFCVPECGKKVRVVFEGVTDVGVGAYMWAYGIGYLEVTFFNALTQEVELRNNCPRNIPDQSAPGTPVPSCTVFIVSPPPVPSATATALTAYPYLNSGFVAPPSSECIDISVTNVNGLSVNKNIAINSGTYRVQQIKSPVLIRICNDGSGLTPGTVVSHDDAAGNLVVPIVLIDNNPCLNTAATHGKLLACTNNVINTLVGTVNGQVPVYDAGTGEINFRTLGIPTLECTPLTVCLTLDPDLPDGTSYLIHVENTEAFTEDQVVSIGGTSLVITSIDGPTMLHARPEEPPTAVQTYNVGAALCSADCCTVLDHRLDVLESYIFDNVPLVDADGYMWLWNEAETADSDTLPDAVIDPGTPAYTGDPVVVTFTNNSNFYSMRLLILLTWTWTIDFAGDDEEVNELSFFASQSGVAGITAVPAGTLYELPETYIFKAIAGGINRHSKQAHYETVVVIPPRDSFTVQASAGVSWNGGNANSATVHICSANVTGFGVAIR